MAGLTPFQTLGPFFDFGLIIPNGEVVADPDAAGRHITVEGVIRDGAGTPLPDALIEIWQADSCGRYRHPADPKHAASDRGVDGFGRVATDDRGRFAFETVMPGRVPGPDGRLQAPHVAVGVLARGILTRLITRMYFADEPSNGEDTVLSLVPASRRGTLLANRVGSDAYRFDIVLQGAGETVFFDV
jgi:protocatechuate 3,4-dioxygenase, alpha subunit